MDLRIAGRKALVLASTKGLGRACATALAREGVHVWINGRTQETVQVAVADIARETGGTVSGVAADLTTEAGRALLVAACPEADILVTNNEGPKPGRFEDWDHAAYIEAFEANMLGPVLMIRALLPGMRARRFGRIVNITSAMVKAPNPHQGLSTAARTALTAVCKAISREAVVDNVTINNLLPERIDTGRQQFLTERQARIDGITFEQARRKLEETIAAKRFGRPDEFGDLCAYLCSEQASYVCGQNIQVDGGSYKGIV